MNLDRRHLLLGGLASLAGCAGGGGTASPTAAEAPPASGMRELTSLQLSKQMGAGWNLGNALEAIGGETAWGNPAVAQAFLQAVAAAGFKTLRLPCAWKQYADANDRIGAAWLDRVAQVAGWARSAGLFVMLNVHWDGGWLQPTFAAQPAANARLASYWTQIATRFRDWDDGLLFAGTNEVMVTGDYGTPKPEYVQVQNGFNQVFVDAVRATGGNNRVRHLVVQGFNTNIDHTLAFAVLPTDVVASRLMMEVHFYDPYHFTIDEQSTLWQWGAGATDPKAKDTWGDEAWVDAQFDKMKAKYVDRGVPVILGEFGVIRRPQYAGSETYREAWTRHVARAAWQRGAVPVWWDNGGLGPNGMGLFDRTSGAVAFPALVNAVVGAVK